MIKVLDKRAILERLDEIRRRRSFLEDYVGETYEEFSGDRSRYELALRDLQVGIQACLDIASHFISARGQERPEETKEYFSILAKEGVITDELAQRLAEAAAVRNILVHSYLQIDLRKIYKHLQEDLPDFDEFVAATSQYLQGLKKIPPLRSG